MGTLFQGIRVLDFTNNAAGPVSTAMMADFGAEVIKVERPVMGDDVRSFAPFVDGQSINFQFYNRGKKSITLSLKDPEGVDIVKRIVADADVVVESFRPGVMKKLGLDYPQLRKLNERLVYCSVSAYGQTGPYAGKPGYDIIAQALCGIMDMTGDPAGPPIKSGFYLGDYIGGMNAFAAITAALYYREKTGTGQYVDVSLLENMVAMNNFIEQAFVGRDLHRTGQHHTGICPYGVFRSRSGQSAVIAAPNDKLWAKVCQAIGRPELKEDERFQTAAARIRHLDEVIEILEDWLSGFEEIGNAVSLLEEAGVPAAKCKSARELLDDPHLLARGTVTDVEVQREITSYPHFKGRGVWLKLSETPGVPGRAPGLGEHNSEILERYGLSQENIDRLQQKWAAK